MIILLFALWLGWVHAVSGVPEDRLAWLRAEIERHDHLYWQELQPEISDAEYDRLVVDWYEKTGTAWQPVVERLEVSERIAHRTPMLSLDKLHTEQDWQRFVRRLARRSGGVSMFRLEPKYDGVAISLVYERGRLLYALTRGTGEYGRNITANLLRTAHIPTVIPTGFADGKIEIRGELYANLTQFEALNQWRLANGANPYPLPRHVAAAFVQVADPEALPQHSLSFVAFDIRGEPEVTEIPSQSSAMGILQAWGFAVPEPAWSEVYVEAVMTKIEAFAKQRTQLHYPTDGLVIKVEDRELQRVAGSTARAPRWAAAWKYPGEIESSEILEIVDSVGATGRITPVAVIHPVQLEGVTVSRVSLHSPGFVERHALRAGKTIRVHLGGGIVPAILVDP